MGFNKKQIMAGYGGFNKSPQHILIPDIEVETAINISRLRRTWAKMQGASKYNAVVINDTSTEIQGLYAFPAHTVITETEITGTEYIAASSDDASEHIVEGGSKTMDIDDDWMRAAWSDYSVEETAWLEPENVSADTEAGYMLWSNPTNVIGSDNNYASCFPTDPAFNSSNRLRIDWINASAFDNIDKSKIVGIGVKIERHASKDPHIVDHHLNIYDAITEYTLKADTINTWPTSDTEASYGDSSDVWGIPATATLADFADGTYKLQFSCVIGDPKANTAYVDNIKIKIYYHRPKSTPALRFTSVAIPAGAAIISAYMKLTPASTMSQTVAHGGSNYICKADHTSGAASEPGVGGSWTTYWRIEASTETAVGSIPAWVTATAYTGSLEASLACTITGINEPDADCDIFTAGIGDPASSRDLTTASEIWTIPTHIGFQMQIDTDDIYDIIQEQIDNSNWATGQDLGFIIEPNSGESELNKDFVAYDEGTAAYKAELYIKYGTEAATNDQLVGLASNKHLYGIQATGAHDDVHTYTNYDAESKDAPIILEGINTAGSKAIFIYQGDDPVRQWDGALDGPPITSDAEITEPPGSVAGEWDGSTTKFPRAAVMHNNRHFCMNVEGHEHTIYYSSATDHEDHLTASGGGTLNVFPGDQEKLVTGFSFMGKLFLFKYPKGIYILDDSSVSASNWGIFKLSDDVGIAGPRAIASVGSEAYFMGSDGFLYNLKSLMATGDVKYSKVKEDAYLDWMNDKITLSDNMSRNTLVYQSSTNLLYCLLSTKDSSDSRIALALDVTVPNKPMLFEYTRDTGASLIDNKGTLQLGGMDGYVWELNDGSYNKNSEAYSCEILTAPIILAQAGISKAGIHAITIVFEGDGTHTCDIAIYGDGSQMGETIQIAKSTAKQATYVTKRAVGECNELQIKITNDEVDTSFSIARIIVHWLPTTERTE